MMVGKSASPAMNCRAKVKEHRYKEIHRRLKTVIEKTLFWTRMINIIKSYPGVLE
ncbi:MAG: hypothetical protein JXL67_02065 [Calditrichaeota bacterium]|nr:hypothetical protein [Calditrichota bacterium]